MKVRPQKRAHPTHRAPILRGYFGDRDLYVDMFAGGGGASAGGKLATGREPDIAINHSPAAIAMHAANNPHTRHFIANVYDVDPRRATEGMPVALLWASPTCTDFSRAKGAALDEDTVKIRCLAWSIIPWIVHSRPAVILLENVEEFLKWGPLHKTHSGGCHELLAARNKLRWERSKLPVARRSKALGCSKSGCLLRCHRLKPIRERQGETFRAFVKKIRSKGYHVDWAVLPGCDFGAPTTRRRLYLRMFADGLPRAWPSPSHGPGRAKPHRTAAEIIDWSLPCPSIFDRERPLKDTTLARIARGVQKFVLEAARPFIVPATHGDNAHGPDMRTHSIDEPLRSITTRGAQFHVAVPYLIHKGNGERPGQDPRTYDVLRPHPTVVSGGIKTELCVAFLNKHNGGHEATGQRADRPLDALCATNTKGLTVAHVVRYNGKSTGQGASEPISTIDTHDRFAIATSHLVKLRGTSDAHLASSSQSVETPCPTISAAGMHLAEVRAFLAKYGGGEAAVVEIDGEFYEIVDIGMRMLTPRELFLAQGFDADYEIAPIGPKGKPLTKTEQIRAVGNSVCPPVARALIEASLGRPIRTPLQAAA